MKVLVLMGATATGKSGLAIAAARTVGREIVSADSRQIYRGLRIGTAQPTATERADVIDLAFPATVHVEEAAVLHAHGPIGEGRRPEGLDPVA